MPISTRQSTQSTKTQQQSKSSLSTMSMMEYNNTLMPSAEAAGKAFAVGEFPRRPRFQT